MKSYILCFLLLSAVLSLLGAGSVTVNQPGEAKSHSGTIETMPAHRPALRTSASGNYSIIWEVLSGGADDASSATYDARMTVGQTATGVGSSATYQISHGFWEEYEVESPYNCGDANSDDAINIADAVYLINYIFKGGPAPEPPCVGDASGDGAVNIGDAVHLINYIFKGGPAPVEDCCP